MCTNFKFLIGRFFSKAEISYNMGRVKGLNKCLADRFNSIFNDFWEDFFVLMGLLNGGEWIAHNVRLLVCRHLKVRINFFMIGNRLKLLKNLFVWENIKCYFVSRFSWSSSRPFEEIYSKFVKKSTRFDIKRL